MMKVSQIQFSSVQVLKEVSAAPCSLAHVDVNQIKSRKKGVLCMLVISACLSASLSHNHHPSIPVKSSQTA